MFCVIDSTTVQAAAIEYEQMRDQTSFVVQLNVSFQTSTFRFLHFVPLNTIGIGYALYYIIHLSLYWFTVPINTNNLWYDWTSVE